MTKFVNLKKSNPHSKFVSLNYSYLPISLTVGGVCALAASCVNSTMQFLSVAAAIRNLTRLLCWRGNEVIYNQIWSIFGPAMPYFALTGFTFVAVQLEYGCKIHKSQSFLPLRTILADISFKSLVQWQQRVTSLFFCLWWQEKIHGWYLFFFAWKNFRRRKFLKEKVIWRFVFFIQCNGWKIYRTLQGLKSF